MSATLYFTDKNNNLVVPGACQCVKPLCKDEWGQLYGMVEDCEHPDLSINMSNTNTRDVLTALGFPGDFENSAAMLPQELYFACDRFLNSELNLFIDNKKESEIFGGNGSATIIHCGRETGYLTGRVQQIKELCEMAMMEGAMRCYFC